MAMSNDAGNTSGIFGDAAKKVGKDLKAARTQLKNIDTVASKVLNPYGMSIIDDVPQDALWKIVSKGDKFCKFFTELAADDKNCADPHVREAIGISRYCETMANLITEWQAADDLRKMLKPAIVAKADEEAEKMMPIFQRLNLGKRGFAKEADDSFVAFKTAKKRKIEADASGGGTLAAPDANVTLDAAVDALLEFLNKGTGSNLRMVVSYLSTGGVFFAAHTFDKTVRAWLAHKDPQPTKDSILDHLKARQSDDVKPKAEVSFKREVATGNLFND